jgi:predicted nuclease with RNAse H fold
MRVVGIDFGAKMAGTTAICFSENGKLSFISAKKGVDADSFILHSLKTLRPTVVGIDAPLSLPKAYQTGCSSKDFMYRLADRELSAMSPMFLGGLTARAMAIAAELRATEVTVVEVYPRAAIRLLTDSETSYLTLKRSRLANGVAALVENLRARGLLALPSAIPANSHELDSLLAFVSADRYSRHEARTFGDQSEGVIHV